MGLMLKYLTNKIYSIFKSNIDYIRFYIHNLFVDYL